MSFSVDYDNIAIVGLTLSTDGDFPNKAGGFNFFYILLDQHGTLLFSNTFGKNEYDGGFGILPYSGGFLMATSTNSDGSLRIFYLLENGEVQWQSIVGKGSINEFIQTVDNKLIMISWSGSNWDQGANKITKFKIED